MSMSASSFGGSCFTLHLSSAYHAGNDHAHHNCDDPLLAFSERCFRIQHWTSSELWMSSSMSGGLSDADRVQFCSIYLISTDLTLNTSNAFDLFHISVQCTSFSHTPTPLRELLLHKGEFSLCNLRSLRCITLLNVKRSTITTVFDLMSPQTAFAISCVRLVLRTEFPSTPDRQSSFTLIWTVSKQPSPDLAVEEIVPLLNKRLAAVSNAGTSEANLRSLESECKTSLRPPSKSNILHMVTYLCEGKSAIVRIGARKEAVNTRRKAEGDKKDVQATAVRRAGTHAKSIGYAEQVHRPLRHITLSIFLVTIIQKAAPVFVRLPVISPEDLKDSASYQKSQRINEDIMLLYVTADIDALDIEIEDFLDKYYHLRASDELSKLGLVSVSPFHKPLKHYLAASKAWSTLDRTLKSDNTSSSQWRVISLRTGSSGTRIGNLASELQVWHARRSLKVRGKRRH
ncbi:hypothetical protein C8J55DRAFT_493565 [Lentinula edodes]|uniref:Uncharacterized protein n=1 Tax=Lentinula lateritia TaxID=40482 RepID=A0A9W8ZTH0_9AGAR|nr:hypothetical protein C8J55DRAFT_493565 [Lentinula edodes]